MIYDDKSKDINAILGTDSSKNKWKKRILYIFILFIIAAAAVYFYISANAEKTVVYDTSEVEQGDIIVQISATGTLQPTNQIEVGSELSGTVLEIFADYNTVVKKGQILAKLDTTKLLSQVTQSRASLDVSKANLVQMQATEKETELKLKQLNQLYDSTEGKSPSKTDLDAAKASYDRAKANVLSAKAQVALAKATLDGDLTDLSKAEIRSPVDGIVLDRNIDEGQTVAASFESPVLFTLAEDLKKMELLVDVDEADIGVVRMNQKASFTVDSYPEKIFNGVIVQTRYGSETVDNVVTYKVVIKVDNTDMLLRPGMTATADITVKEMRNVIKIPKTALRYSPPAQKTDNSSFISKLMPRPLRNNTKKRAKTLKNGEMAVWALENGVAVPYNVKIGDSSGDYNLMTDGDLKAGMKLIIGTSRGN